VLAKDLDTINGIAETMMKYSKSLAGDSVPPRQAERFFESILARTRDISSTRIELEEEILQLSRQIDALSTYETKKRGKTDGEVTVVIMAKKTVNLELKLTYRMSPSLLDLLKTLSYSLICYPQSPETRHGVQHTSYMPPQKLVFPHHPYLCIIVPGSCKALAKIGGASNWQ